MLLMAWLFSPHLPSMLLYLMIVCAGIGLSKKSYFLTFCSKSTQVYVHLVF